MDYKQLLLENQLCFPLYAAAKEVTRQYTPLLDEVGLTYTQYITMMVLWEHKSLSVKELGAYLYLDSGTITPLLKKLEAHGLVTRERLSTDERVTQITLTTKGELPKSKVADIPKKVGACIPLSLEESKQLYFLLYKILGKID